MLAMTLVAGNIRFICGAPDQWSGDKPPEAEDLLAFQRSMTGKIYPTDCIWLIECLSCLCYIENDFKHFPHEYWKIK